MNPTIRLIANALNGMGEWEGATPSLPIEGQGSGDENQNAKQKQLAIEQGVVVETKPSPALDSDTVLISKFIVCQEPPAAKAGEYLAPTKQISIARMEGILQEMKEVAHSTVVTDSPEALTRVAAIIAANGYPHFRDFVRMASFSDLRLPCGIESYQRSQVKEMVENYIELAKHHNNESVITKSTFGSVWRNPSRQLYAFDHRADVLKKFPMEVYKNAEGLISHSDFQLSEMVKYTPFPSRSTWELELAMCDYILFGLKLLPTQGTLATFWDRIGVKENVQHNLSTLSTVMVNLIRCAQQHARKLPSKNGCFFGNTQDIFIPALRHEMEATVGMTAFFNYHVSKERAAFVQRKNGGGGDGGKKNNDKKKGEDKDRKGLSADDVLTHDLNKQSCLQHPRIKCARGTLQECFGYIGCWLQGCEFELHKDWVRPQQKPARGRSIYTKPFFTAANEKVKTALLERPGILPSAKLIKQLATLSLN